MLTNEQDPQVQRRLEECRRDVPESVAFLNALRLHSDPFGFRVSAPGYEFLAGSTVDGRPNRAILKLFRVPDGPLEGQAAAFFYKPSRIPTSRDRFSYGVCMIPRTGPESGDVEAWILFASSGFRSNLRPARIRRAFTFNVPD